MPKCRIAAIVPTYNREHQLEACVGSLLRQTRPLDEILVVDNASTDGTAEMLRMEFPDNVSLVRLPRNAGSAGGFHEGIKVAYQKGYDWIWSMDNDAEAAADALQKLVDSPLSDDPQTGILASVVMGADSRVEAHHHKRITAFFRELAVTDEDVRRNSTIPLESSGWAGALIRRKAIETVGLPLKDFFLFYDDTEYTYRISRSFKIYLVAASRVMHRPEMRRHAKGLAGFRGSTRFPVDPPSRLYYATRNRFFFITRHSRRWRTPLAIASVLGRLVGGVLLYDDSKLKRVRLTLKAVKDGVLGKLGPADGLSRDRGTGGR